MNDSPPTSLAEPSSAAAQVLKLGCVNVSVPAVSVPTPAELISLLCDQISSDRVPLIALVRMSRPSFHVKSVRLAHLDVSGTVTAAVAELSSAQLSRSHPHAHTSPATEDSGVESKGQVLVAMLPADGDLEQIRQWLTGEVPQGVEVLDRLIVRGRRWWSALCADDTCCPVEGTVVVPWNVRRCDHAEGGVGGECGCEALDADSLPLWLKTPGAATTHAIAEFLGTINDARPVVAAAVTFDDRLELIDRIDAAAAASEADPLLVAAVHDVRLRDGLLRRWVVESDDQHQAAVELALIDCLSYLDADMQTPVLTVLAGLTWRRGAPALARQCVEVALRRDPHYSLARLLHRALRQQVPADVWLQAVEATSMAECLVGSGRFTSRSGA